MLYYSIVLPEASTSASAVVNRDTPALNGSDALYDVFSLTEKLDLPLPCRKEQVSRLQGSLETLIFIWDRARSRCVSLLFKLFDREVKQVEVSPRVTLRVTAFGATWNKT